MPKEPKKEKKALAEDPKFLEWERRVIDVLDKIKKEFTHGMKVSLVFRTEQAEGCLLYTDDNAEDLGRAILSMTDHAETVKKFIPSENKTIN